MKGDEGLFFTDTLTNAVLSLDFWIIDYLEAKDSVVIPIEVKAATRGIFSLPTQEFFRGQGKIKVGRETKKRRVCHKSVTHPLSFSI